MRKRQGSTRGRGKEAMSKGERQRGKEHGEGGEGREKARWAVGCSRSCSKRPANSRQQAARTGKVHEQEAETNASRSPPPLGSVLIKITTLGVNSSNKLSWCIIKSDGMLYTLPM